MVSPLPRGFGVTTPYRRAGHLWSLGFHTGADYAAPLGTSVYACADGRIQAVDFTASYGYRVVIESVIGGATYRHYYCHLPGRPRHLKVGQRIKAGKGIARIGLTGNTTGPHLHLEVRVPGYGFATATFRDPRVVTDWRSPGKTQYKAVKARATYTVTASKLNGRQTPGNGKILETLTKGKRVGTTHRAVIDGEVWVRTSARKLWLAERHLKRVIPPRPKPKKDQITAVKATYTVTASVLNARVSPVNGRVAEQFKQGKRITTDARQVVNGSTWVRTAVRKRWVAEAHLQKVTAKKAVAKPAPKPAPKPLSILPRSDWTDAPNGRAGRDLDPGRVTAMTIHWGGDHGSLAGFTKARIAARLRSYRAGHLGRGWADIGYNYAVDLDGRVWLLTGDVIGAHAGEAGNPTSLGVILVLGQDDEPTPAMKASLQALFAAKRKAFPEMKRYQGHQQVPGNNTECPGQPAMALIRTLNG